MDKLRGRLKQVVEGLESTITDKTNSLNVELLQQRKEACKGLLDQIDQRLHQPTIAVRQATTQNNAATQARLAQNRDKTEKIQEKMVRYVIDPETQVRDIHVYIDSAYEKHALKKEYDLAREVIKSGDASSVPEEMKTPQFYSILGALTEIEILRQSIKPYGDPEAYHFNPKVLALIGRASSALISFDLLQGNTDEKMKSYGPYTRAISVLNALQEQGKKVTVELRGQPIGQVVNSADLIKQGPTAAYNHLYPAILPGSLGVYTFKASTYAFANSMGLVGLAKSERGVHGGLYKEPLVIFCHDVIHHEYIIRKENPEVAARFLELSRNLYEVVNAKVPEDQQEYFYFGTHMLLHENDFFQEKAVDKQCMTKQSRSELLEATFCGTLETAFNDFKLSSKIEPIEPSLRAVEGRLLDKSKLNPNTLARLEKQLKEYEQYKLSSDIESVVKKEGHDPFPFDIVESLLYVTNDPAKKAALEAQIVPGLSEFKIKLYNNEELKNKYSINPSDKTSQNYKDYQKECFRQIYEYKTTHYDTLEGYKAIRAFLTDIKDKIKPWLEEIDQQKGTITTDAYINVWDQGLALGKKDPSQ